MVDIMEFKLLSKEEKETYAEQILNILVRCDADFVPPLSTRYERDWETAYFANMKAGEILAAVEDRQVRGFVAYKKNYLYEDVITEATFPNLYVGTLLVHPDARGRHLSREMYSHLFGTLCPHESLFTRTWSTNTAHIGILSRFGFSEIARIKNDRAVGIDTVYFGKIQK